MSVIKRSPVIDGLKKNFQAWMGGQKNGRGFPLPFSRCAAVLALSL